MQIGLVSHLYRLNSRRVKRSGSALYNIPILIDAEVTSSASVDFQYLTGGSEVKYFQRTKIFVRASLTVLGMEYMMYIKL
jgi:hypothetical protein